MIEDLKILVSIYYDIQDVRIRTANRLRNVEADYGVDVDKLKQMEKRIAEEINRLIEDDAVYENFLSKIPGLGSVLSGGLLAYFDPSKARHVSSFWKYAGLHVVNGRAVERRYGQKIDYNPEARTLCWKIGKSFVRKRTPYYREIYDNEKKRLHEKIKEPEKDCPWYEECIKKLKKRRKPPCDGHIDAMARRKMVKRFLADFWIVYRYYLGYEINKPYPVEKLGHKIEISPYLPVEVKKIIEKW